MFETEFFKPGFIPSSCKKGMVINMVSFVMEFGNVEVGRSAAKLLISLGYPAAYFIHDCITNGKFIEYGTIEMIAPKKVIFE